MEDQILREQGLTSFGSPSNFPLIEYVILYHKEWVQILSPPLPGGVILGQLLIRQLPHL